MTGVVAFLFFFGGLCLGMSKAGKYRLLLYMLFLLLVVVGVEVAIYQPPALTLIERLM